MRRLTAVLLLSLPPLVAQAHDSRPLFIEVVEQGAGLFALHWRPPPVVPKDAWPVVTLEEGECRAVAGAVAKVNAFGQMSGMHGTWYCPMGINGSAVRIDYPTINPSLTTLLNVRWLSGESRVLTAAPDELRLVLPAGETLVTVARGYLRLGVEHILRGPDHLLFLACLLWIAGTPRRIVLSITGFTLAHSVTLGLATFDMVRVPIKPMEACIALSVLLLAAEIVRDRRDTLSWRFPVVASLLFGLLHGFGFASVLQDIGLPQTQVAGALLFFNVGVELGQLLFAGLLIALVAALRRIASRTAAPAGLVMIERHAVLASGYFIGAIAAYWFVARSVALLA